MEKCRLKPLGARVVVREERFDSETESGIIIPGRENEHTNKGVVLRVGPGAMLEDHTVVPVPVNVGDTVLYSSFSGFPVKFKEDEDELYIVLNERDIICVDEGIEEDYED